MTRVAARWLLAAVLAPAAPLAGAAGPGELLDPDQAFRLEARPLDARTVGIEFEIAEGYYMYRDRFAFATAAGGTIGDAVIPRGKLKDDPFFGKTEILRDRVLIRVPLRASDIGADRAELVVTSQGCADAGVCYLPQVRPVSVGLPAGAPNPPR